MRTGALDLRSERKTTIDGLYDLGALAAAAASTGAHPVPALDFPDAGLAIAFGNVEAATEARLAHADHDEIVIVRAGRLRLGGMRFDPGSAALLRRGSSADLATDGAARWIALRYFGGTDTASGTGLQRIEPVLPRGEAATPADEVLLTPAPTCRIERLHRSPSGRFVCGVWDATPYARRAVPYPQYELMYLLDGEIEIRGADGGAMRFAKGDVAFLEKGAVTSWKNDSYVRKLFCSLKLP
jgi:uncharacterized cupin superfamily protein